MITWFLMMASSSLIRASIIPCSFLAAWYSKFSDRSPSSRAALIFETMFGRRTLMSSSSSLRTDSSPSGVMWTSLVINWSLITETATGSAVYSRVHAKAAAHDRDALDGYGHGRRGRGVSGRHLAPAAGPGGGHPRVGGGRRAGNRAHGRRHQPIGQHRVGPRGNPVRLRGPGVRGRLLLPLARGFPPRAGHIRAGVQPPPDRDLPAAPAARAAGPGGICRPRRDQAGADEDGRHREDGRRRGQGTREDL